MSLCLETVITTWGGGQGELEVKAAATHPTMHSIASTAKNYLAQNVSSAEVEKACPTE